MQVYSLVSWCSHVCTQYNKGLQGLRKRILKTYIRVWFPRGWYMARKRNCCSGCVHASHFHLGWTGLAGFLKKLHKPVWPTVAIRQNICAYCEQRCLSHMTFSSLKYCMPPVCKSDTIETSFPGMVSLLIFCSTVTFCQTGFLNPKRARPVHEEGWIYTPTRAMVLLKILLSKVVLNISSNICQFLTRPGNNHNCT